MELNAREFANDARLADIQKSIESLKQPTQVLPTPAEDNRMSAIETEVANIKKHLCKCCK